MISAVWHMREKSPLLDWRTKFSLLSWSTFRYYYQIWTMGINTTLTEELVLLLKLFSSYSMSQKNLNKQCHKLRKGQWIRCKSYSSVVSSYWKFYWKITIKMGVHLFLVTTAKPVEHIMTEKVSKNVCKYFGKKSKTVF